MEEKITSKLRNKKLIIVLALLLLLFLLPSRGFSSNKSEQLETVMVTGEAILKEKNQVARFNVEINSSNDNKSEAVDDVSKRTETIIKVIKNFGIDNKDIETRNMNVYQEEIRDRDSSESKKGQWRASNSLEVILREVDKSSELASLLSSNEIDRVSGPSFYLEDLNQKDGELSEMAMENAREKAKTLAKSADKKLGDVIKIIEGGNSKVYPVGMKSIGLEMDSAIPVEPGSSQLSKSITVVFELK